MYSMTSKDYVRRLEKWFNFAEKYFYTPSQNPDIMCFGTGESHHWAVQANMTAFSALAVLAMSPELEEKNISVSRSELQKTALKLLRYSIRTHKSGTEYCTNNQQWGLSWISGLSLERMRHGYEAIEELLEDDDRNAMRRIMEAESNFLLDEYEIKAGFGYYENKPESNLWNGAVLLRTATYYPDFERKNECLQKAMGFFANGISVPSDAESELPFGGSRVCDLHVGANFTGNYSLNHHDYMNVGYAALSLSNIGFLHFSFKNQGYELPQEVYFHAEELWKNLKNFIFRDGRLLRCGGDGRIRYSYCQDYAVPAWLFAYDKFKDEDALQFEKKWFEIIDFEASQNMDGSFLGSRLDNIRKSSPFYYTRLEGDRAVSCSFGAYWREKNLFAAPVDFTEKPPLQIAWNDDFHAASVVGNEKRLASWCWKSCMLPTGIFVPPHRSDMAEWEYNLGGEFVTSNRSVTELLKSAQKNFDGGFVTCGKIAWTEKNPLGEGELPAVYAEHGIAFCALPDGASAVVLQYAKAVRRIYLRRIQGLNLKMPNDIYNDSKRSYYSAEGKKVLCGMPGKTETVDFDSPWLNIDNEMRLYNIYGSSGFSIFRHADRQIECLDFPHKSIYADVICTEFAEVEAFVDKDTVLLDNGTLLVCGENSAQCSSENIICKIPDSEKYPALRMVEICSRNNRKYIFAANFGDIEAEIQNVILQPFESALIEV